MPGPPQMNSAGLLAIAGESVLRHVFDAFGMEVQSGGRGYFHGLILDRLIEPVREFSHRLEV